MRVVDAKSSLRATQYFANLERTIETAYGLRGLAYFKVTVKGPAADLHSGVFGGTVHEPMTDLFAIFSKLVTPQGEILIPGINELVAPLTDEERQRYETIDFSLADVEGAAGSKTALKENKAEILMGRMRYPSLSIHGIEGAFSTPGAKTVIPAAVHGKFSIRLVPDLSPEKVAPLVKTYLQDQFKQLGTKNTLHVEALHGGQPWLSDPNHWFVVLDLHRRSIPSACTEASLTNRNFVAAAKATKEIYGVEPDLTREGGSCVSTGVETLLLLPCKL